MERRNDKYDPLDELQYEDYKNAPSMTVHGPKTFGFHYSQQAWVVETIDKGILWALIFFCLINFSTQEKVVKSVTVIRNDDSESTNSDTETWNSIKERNLKNLKRKAIHSRSRKQQDMSTTDSSDLDENNHKDSGRYYERKYKMSSAASSSSSNSKKSGDLEQQQKQLQQQQDQTNVQSSESSSRPPKRKKSRWSELPKVQTVVVPPPVTSASAAAVPTASTVAAATVAAVVDVKPMLSTLTRSDPALLSYARLNFGTTNLSEDDWKKAEEHYKINLLFQDMQRKRQEIEQLAKKGKFKYEYDSDEVIDDCSGTWEHKLRSQEMEATLKWAEALNQQCQGKHHIGDFLPPGERTKGVLLVVIRCAIFA
jgi:hypothetical protein